MVGGGVRHSCTGLNCLQLLFLISSHWYQPLCLLFTLLTLQPGVQWLLIHAKHLLLLHILDGGFNGEAQHLSPRWHWPRLSLSALFLSVDFHFCRIELEEGEELQAKGCAAPTLQQGDRLYWVLLWKTTLHRLQREIRPLHLWLKTRSSLFGCTVIRYVHEC